MRVGTLPTSAGKRTGWSIDKWPDEIPVMQQRSRAEARQIAVRHFWAIGWAVQAEAPPRQSLLHRNNSEELKP